MPASSWRSGFGLIGAVAAGAAWYLTLLAMAPYRQRDAAREGLDNTDALTGRGGWAALIERDGTTFQLVGSAVDTTHNRMGLTAVCEALEQLSGAIEVRTDSTYIQKCFRDGWHIRWRRDDK